MYNRKTNFKSAKILIEIYENITMEDLKKTIKFQVDKSGTTYMQGSKRIIGFTSEDDCILCKEASILKKEDKNEDPEGSICVYCIYKKDFSYLNFGTPCLLGENEETYFSILYAENYNDLYNAYKKRAKHIKQVYNRLKNDKN